MRWRIQLPGMPVGSLHDAVSVEEALRRVREGSGTQFDPEVVNVFLELVEDGQIQVVRDG